VLGETLQQGLQSAAIGAKSKLEPLADTVKRLGNGIMEQEARRVREAGRAGRPHAR
jgi:hypothetical protein